MRAMTNYISSETIMNGKKLIFTVTNHRDDFIPKNIEVVVADAFAKISPCIKGDTQVVHMRDNSIECRRGEGNWSARCNSRYEADIAIPMWFDDCLDMEHFRFALHQTLYKMARLQNTDVSLFFSDEIFNRGLAAYYAYTMTGYTPPFIDQHLKATKTMRKVMLKRWFDWYDGFNKGWLHEPCASQAIAVGYELAETLCGRRGIQDFCLREAISLHGYRYFDTLWALNHPGRKKSARIFAKEAYRQPGLPRKYSPSAFVTQLQEFLLVPRPELRYYTYKSY
jgi:hypothetical protein